jgi:hypothetical protein
MEALKVISWKVIGYSEKVFQACPGEPIRAGGSCDNCARGIRYVVRVRSSEGHEMDVGEDCAVTLAGGIELRDIRAAEREWQRQEYLASPEYSAKVARQMLEKAEAAERASKAREEFAMELEGLELAVNSPNVSDYAKGKISQRISGILSGNAKSDWTNYDARDFLVAYLAALVPPSKPAGKVGDKVEFKAVLEAMIPIESQFGNSYIQKFRASTGESLVWFSAAGEHGPVHIGSVVKIKGTVKSHKEYQGEAQTTLSRCKVVFVEKFETRE